MARAQDLRASVERLVGPERIGDYEMNPGVPKTPSYLASHWNTVLARLTGKTPGQIHEASKAQAPWTEFPRRPQRGRLAEFLGIEPLGPEPPPLGPERPPTVDITEAGAQPRLPGDVGAVRDVEVPTPKEELPFNLAREEAAPKPPEPPLEQAPLEEPDRAEILRRMQLEPNADPIKTVAAVLTTKGPLAREIFQELTGKSIEEARGRLTAQQVSSNLWWSKGGKYFDKAREIGHRLIREATGQEPQPPPPPVSPEEPWRLPHEPPLGPPEYPPPPEPPSVPIRPSTYEGRPPVLPDVAAPKPPEAPAPPPPEEPPPIVSRHEVKNQEAVDRIAADMKERGWRGRPAVVVRDGDRRLAWTATHRLAAAQQAGLTDIPTIEIDGAKLREAGYDIDQLTQMGKKARIKALRDVGLEDAAKAMELERQVGGRAKEGIVTEGPKVPDNVRDFLVRQLRYTPDQVTAMSYEDAIRIGRERIRNPNLPPPRSAPLQPGEVPRPPVLPPLPKGEAPAPAVRRPGEFPVGVRKTGALHELLVKKTPPEMRPGETTRMARTAEERAAAGEPLTLTEREQLGMPPPEPKVARPDLRKKGMAPRQLEARAKYMKDLADNPTEKNLEKLAAEIDAQAERIGRKGLKKGREGEKPLRKSEEEGFIIGGGLGGLQNVKKLIQKDPILAWKATMAAMGGVAGWNFDEDHPARGAILGALAGGSAVHFTQALQKAKVSVPGRAIAAKASTKIGPQPGPEALRVARDPTQDIGLFELMGGSPERTIPDQFRRAQPAFEQFARELRAEHARTKAVIPQKRVQAIRQRIVGPVISSIRKDAKAAKAAGNRYKASYLNAFANRLSGYQTLGQRAISTLTKGKLRPDFIERQVAGNTYRILTGWGLDTALQNLTQPLLAMAHVPPSYIVQGIKEYTTDTGRALVKRHLLELERPVDLIESTLGDYGEVAAGYVKKFPDSQIFLRKTDNINRGVTFLSGYRYAKAQGAADKDAAEWALGLMRKTQGEPGALGSNPFHAGPIAGSLRPFTKYPTIFTEHAIDVLKQAGQGQNLRGAATMFGTAAGLVMLGKLTGIDMENLLVSGGRPLGFSIAHPGASIKRIASGEAFPATRAAKEIFAHATGTADHDFLSLENFMQSDVGSFAIPRYPRQAIETATAVLGKQPTVERRGAGGKLIDVRTKGEALANLLGLKTTRQTERQHALQDFYAKGTEATTEYKSARSRAYERLQRGLENEDRELVAEALRDIGDAGAVKRFMKRRRQLPEERFFRTLPPKVRRQLQPEFEALEGTRPH
jgi:hypothetical protein